MATKKPVKKNNKASRQQLSSFPSKFKKVSFGESRAYLFEYGLLLLVVGGLVGVATSMLSSVINILGTNDTGRQFADQAAVDQSVLTLSVALVLLPLLFILSNRTIKTEATNPLIKNTNWRKAFLGIFLATLTITAIGVAISHVNGLLSYLVQGSDSFDWRSQLGSAMTVLILGLTAGVVASDYRHTSVDKYPGMRQRFYNALLVFILLVGLFFAVGPLAEQQSNVEQDRRHHHGYGDRCTDYFGSPEDDNIMQRPLLESY